MRVRMSSLKVRESFDKSQSSEELPYAPARHVESLDDCYFYHTMDIPNHRPLAPSTDVTTSWPVTAPRVSEPVGF